MQPVHAPNRPDQATDWEHVETKGKEISVGSRIHRAESTNLAEEMGGELDKEAHTDQAPVGMCEERRAKHSMLHCIEDANATGASILLLPNGETGILTLVRASQPLT